MILLLVSFSGVKTTTGIDIQREEAEQCRCLQASECMYTRREQGRESRCEEGESDTKKSAERKNSLTWKDTADNCSSHTNVCV